MMATTISHCLKKNNSLQVLNISYNIISNSALINIGKGLQVNTALKMLDISYNKISDDGVCTFSDYLKKRNNLQNLRISWNNGIYFAIDTTVKSCAMCKMSLGDAGTILLSAFLYSNTNLQKN